MLTDFVFLFSSSAYSTQLDGLNNSSRLYSTLKYLTRRSPAPEILMTYTPRREEEKQFFELMSQDFCWQSIPACQLLPDHEIDERIVILHVHRSQAAAAPSVRESVHTKEMSSFLTEEQRRQEEIMKQKIEAKRAKKIKVQSDTA
jgi:carboxylesterase type B